MEKYVEQLRKLEAEVSLSKMSEEKRKRIAELIAELIDILELYL